VSVKLAEFALTPVRSSDPDARTSSKETDVKSAPTKIALLANVAPSKAVWSSNSACVKTASRANAADAKVVFPTNSVSRPAKLARPSK
jgi:hypothetical protein